MIYMKIFLKDLFVSNSKERKKGKEKEKGEREVGGRMEGRKERKHLNQKK
jgi:hypothetical protein